MNSQAIVTAGTDGVRDDTLLMQAMLLMMGADGYIDEEELIALECYFMTLPEFRDKSFIDVHESALSVIGAYEAPSDSVEALKDLSSAALKRKCYLLAVDIAMANYHVDESERKLLSEMQAILDVADDDASRIRDVLAIKYASE